MKNYSIGIDIGGTNIDIVLVDQNKNIVASCKKGTCIEIETIIIDAIYQLLQIANVDASLISRVFFGTTHALNAILQQKELLSVAVLRIASNTPDIPPGFSWHKSLLENVICAVETVPGGHECEGTEMESFCPDITREKIKKLLEAKPDALAIVATFSPVNNSHELLAKSIAEKIAPKELPISLSHEIGSLGFIERENGTILNAALQKVIGALFTTMEEKLQSIGISGRLHIIQNNGTVMDLAEAKKFPIRTIASGQTNSIIGAAKLAGIDQACVIDIGGTSTDIGILQAGIPRRSSARKEIGSVRLETIMPDLISLPLGGGSIIEMEKEKYFLSGKSVANQLISQALSFGGDKFTLTDVGVALGLLKIENSAPIKTICKKMSQDLLGQIQKQLESTIRIMKNKVEMPTIIVGGAAPILLPLIDKGHIPKHAEVANAYGACFAQISYTLEKVVSLKENRAEILNELKKQCLKLLSKKEIEQSTKRITSVEIIPYSYSSENLASVLITAAAEIAVAEHI